MRIGIFGGTFDPVHNGHIYCAHEIMQGLSLDRIIFIPTGEPPHKISRRITPAADRLEMLRAAVRDCDKMYVSDMECTRGGVTYTYDTLKELRRIYAQTDELYMIVGADTLKDMLHWHRSEDVLKMCAFAAMKRPGSSDDEFYAALDSARKAGAAVEAVNVPVIDISSTDIRKKVSVGEDISQLVPEGAREYIEKHGLYRPHSMEFDEIYADVRTLMSEKRFKHSIGVMNECVRLARIFGADEHKCRLAGLLHDCAKELSYQQYRWLGVIKDIKDISDSDDSNGTKDINDTGEQMPDYDANEVLLHAKAGAILAERRYGVSDPEILEAIECHVTGRPGMGLTARILFVADYTEPGRQGDVFDAVRQRINEGSLELAILEECDGVIKYNMSKKGVRICTEGVRTRNWILDIIEKNGKEDKK